MAALAASAAMGDQKAKLEGYQSALRQSFQAGEVEQLKQMLEHCMISPSSTLTNDE